MLNLQIQSTSLLVNDLQFMNQKLQQEFDAMDEQNVQQTAENTQVSKQLEHRIKNLQQQVIDQLHDAMYCAKICAYAQGFQLMKLAAKEHGWTLDFSSIAKIWRAGCIIRAAFLQSISNAYQRNENLDNLLLDDYFAKELNERQQNWRKAICHATMQGVPIGALSSSLAYYDSMRSETLPANLLQGQRDFFGAHTFERIDKTAGKKFHVQWSTKGKETILIDG